MWFLKMMDGCLAELLPSGVNYIAARFSRPQLCRSRRVSSRTSDRKPTNVSQHISGADEGRLRSRFEQARFEVTGAQGKKEFVDRFTRHLESKGEFVAANCVTFQFGGRSSSGG